MAAQMTHDDDADHGRERRAWQRILIDLEVDYGHEDNFLFAYIRDISATGIFIATKSPEPPGTLLNMRFVPPGGSGESLALEGEVIWINKFQPSNRENIHPGMGIRFTGLSKEQRQLLAELVKTFAYLSD